MAHPAGTILTVGHSTRTLDDLLALLRGFAIETLVDVRSYPGSRRHPQFNRESLETTIPEAGVRYVWLRALGGRRRSPKGFDSPNAGWRHPAFRSYADYMMTPAFRVGLEELLAIAAESITVIMCSEAVYWRCHRRLISDALVTRGVVVQHIMSPSTLRPHTLTPGAIVQSDSSLLYPAPPDPEQATLFE